MDVYLWPLVSCRLFTTIIRQRNKDIWKIEKIEKYTQRNGWFVYNSFLCVCMYVCICVCFDLSFIIIIIIIIIIIKCLYQRYRVPSKLCRIWSATNPLSEIVTTIVTTSHCCYIYIYIYIYREREREICCEKYGIGFYAKCTIESGILCK